MRLDNARIDILLAKKSWTKARLASECGVARQNISAILGRGSCEPKTVGRLASALGVTVEEIIKKEK